MRKNPAMATKTTDKQYHLYSLVVGPIETNCYIFGSVRTGEVVIIDPGDDYEKIMDLIEAERLKPQAIVNTHGHVDHIGANNQFNLPVYIHRLDADFLSDPMKSLAAWYGNKTASARPQRLLEDNDEINIADLSLSVLHTPGHTPGGISLHYDGIVFTGDALFQGGVGRTDFPYSDEKQLIRSIKDKLFTLDDKVIVLPGHGPKTTIGMEKNYYLGGKGF